VANLAQTLAQFQAANVSAADVTAFLAQRFPDGQGGTTVSPSYVFTETPVNTTTGEPAIPAADKMNAVGGTLLAEIPGLAAADVAVPAASPPADVRFSQGQVETIREKVATELARRMQLQLRDMARDGMRGIEVTDGRILSRLTFGVTTTDTAERVQSTYHSNNLSASVQGGFRRRRFGISGGVSGGFVNVNTVNERTFSSVSMSAQIVGEVELRFRTRTYLPPAPAPA
jgi:hypothetical protein